MKAMMSPAAPKNSTSTTHGHDILSSMASLLECSSRSKLLHQSKPFVLAQRAMQPSF